MKVPDGLVKKRFEKSGQCNEVIRAVYQQWAALNGFLMSAAGGFTYWTHPDGTYLRVLPTSGVIVVEP